MPAMMEGFASGAGKTTVGGFAGEGGGGVGIGGGSVGGGGGGSGNPWSMRAVKSVRWLMLQNVEASPPKKVTDSVSTPRISGGCSRACSDVLVPESDQLSRPSSQNAHSTRVEQLASR